ncbi:MAG: 4'-phosphopantetheinyl transferase superfamily protein [Saprospiraceae bacterium]|nr:MAG: 4'-phosphopantetheinyl transferase [Bacteroidetes bacterium OLB9]MCO6462968.1 4'-phosphopantetheinyl transferase superfamily protein [Saprospiraceae bacterium]MCZ2338281.1 4'-phosphopantetheinyl transferase superfamily protein [Chitinophagales bacterium]
MPLLYQSHIANGGVFGIWDVKEDETFFERKIDFYPEEFKELEGLRARKKMEWLSSRYLLHVLSQREIRGACLKDEFGKPYLKDSPFHISISHSSSCTAVIGSPAFCGIDIQIIVPKIERIAPRFINTVEWEYIPDQDKILYFHTLWGAKEAMYKSFGRRGLDFRKDMNILPFMYQADGFFFRGSVVKNDFNKNYTLFCRQFDHLILVYALQEN